VFCLVPQFLTVGRRQYEFILRGLEEDEKIPEFISTHKAAMLVTDFDPLKIKRQWKDAVSQRIAIPFYEVDAHNIFPCWLASPKQEFSARTLRIKYELDCRDPNGYDGCAWSIGGLHDRPWQERPVFGTIRYMNENGCRRKFDVDAYVEKIRML
jgi:deoxyribodipyrimidine photolyase